MLLACTLPQGLRHKDSLLKCRNVRAVRIAGLVAGYDRVLAAHHAIFDRAETLIAGRALGYGNSRGYKAGVGDWSSTGRRA